MLKLNNACQLSQPLETLYDVLHKANFQTHAPNNCSHGGLDKKNVSKKLPKNAASIHSSFFQALSIDHAHSKFLS